MLTLLPSIQVYLDQLSTVKRYFHCIVILSLWNVEILLHFPSVLLVFTRPLIGN